VQHPLANPAPSGEERAGEEQADELTCAFLKTLTNVLLELCVCGCVTTQINREQANDFHADSIVAGMYGVVLHFVDHVRPEVLPVVVVSETVLEASSRRLVSLSGGATCLKKCGVSQHWDFIMKQLRLELPCLVVTRTKYRVAKTAGRWGVSVPKHFVEK
jgi:hypothetical protein